MDTSVHSLKYVRLIILAFCVGMALNLLPGWLILPVVAGGLLLLIIKCGVPSVLAALTLFGHAFYALIKKDLGLATTYCFIGLALTILLIFLINRRPASIFYNSRFLPDYLIWCGCIYLIMGLGYYLGPKTGYSLYLIQFFLVYASYCILTGLLTVRSGVSVADMVLPSLLLWSCSFPLMGYSLLRLPSHLSSAYLGLRGVEGFATLGQGRLSGLMLTMIILFWVSAPNKKKFLPEVILGVAISAPLLWYSLSRQALASTFITVILIIMMVVFRRDLVKQYYQKVVIFILAVSIFFGVISWAADSIETTRMSESGLLGGKTGGSRYEIWIRSLQYIEAKPLIGYGLGSFTTFRLGHAGGGLPDWPHNWFIEAWLEHGLPGLILFLLGAIMLLRPLFAKSGMQITSWAILGVYWFIVIQLSGDIARNSLIFFFITVVALTRGDSPSTSPLEEPGKDAIYQKD